MRTIPIYVGDYGDIRIPEECEKWVYRFTKPRGSRAKPGGIMHKRLIRARRERLNTMLEVITEIAWHSNKESLDVSLALAELFKPGK